MLQIQPLHPDDWNAALTLVYSNVSADERPTRIAHCQQLIESQVLDPHGIFVAKRGEVVVGVQVCAVLPGASCTFWLPAATEDCADALVRTAMTWACGKECKVLQALASPGDLALAEPLVRNGFRCTTWMQQLARTFVDLPPEQDRSLSYEPVHAANVASFASTIEQSYLGSLDCPELNGKRTIEETIAGHRGQGRYTPDFWWLVSNNNESVGVVILVEQPDGVTWELAYLGVVPAFRRQGFARAMLLHSLHSLSEQPATQVIVAVDDRNLPAIDLYRSVGFTEVERNLVLLYFPG